MVDLQVVDEEAVVEAGGGVNHSGRGRLNYVLYAGAEPADFALLLATAAQG